MPLRRLQLAAMLCLGLAGATRPAEARVDIRVDLASQTMTVASRQGVQVWPVSSARTGFRTPRGTFAITRLETMHRSRKYHNSPMPHSMFFLGGYAIHGTYATAALGRPASHGCIRLAPAQAAALFRMVAAEGGRVSITGAPRDDVRLAARRLPVRVARVRAYDGYGLRGTQAPPPDALGYAPVVSPSVLDWLRDPTGR